MILWFHAANVWQRYEIIKDKGFCLKSLLPLTWQRGWSWAGPRRGISGQWWGTSAQSLRCPRSTSGRRSPACPGWVSGIWGWKRRQSSNTTEEKPAQAPCIHCWLERAQKLTWTSGKFSRPRGEDIQIRSVVPLGLLTLLLPTFTGVRRFSHKNRTQTPIKPVLEHSSLHNLPFPVQQSLWCADSALSAQGCSLGSGCHSLSLGSPAQNSSGSLEKGTLSQPLRLLCHRGTVPKAPCAHQTKWGHKKFCTSHGRKVRTSHVSCSDSGHCLKHNQSWALSMFLPDPKIQKLMPLT